MRLTGGLEFALAGEFRLAWNRLAGAIAVEHRERVTGLLAFIDIGENVVVSAIKKAQRDNSLVVRVFNPSPSATNAAFTFRRPIRKVDLVDLNELAIEKVASKGSSFSLKVGPKKIATVKVRIE